ncbi:MAG: protein-tyrosine phosphatase [Verrucomicrobiaceae bacterium]|nr:protein-tyrosine phosphatase [Verrucomicrobiaceae bacterium]
MADTFQRVLNLEGSCNLRDMGGYPAADGRCVQTGKLFRSGVLAYLTETDKQRIAELGIRAVCDLRRSDERADEPTQWPVDANVKFFIWDDEPDVESAGELSWQNAKSGEHIRDVMIKLYRNMPAWLENRLRGVFEYLAAGNVPLLFHCAAGKDRTGLTASLILHSLGVDRETILADYALTNTAVDLGGFMMKHKKAGMGLTDQEHPLKKMAPDVREALLSADPVYLSAALDQIEQDYKTIDNFLNERFGITPELQKHVRDQLLTAR